MKKDEISALQANLAKSEEREQRMNIKVEEAQSMMGVPQKEV